MGKQREKKAPATPDKFFVLGFDNKGKPRGARFAEYNERVLNFVSDLMLTSVYPASAAFTEVAMKLPPGRIYASGKAFIPPIKRDLVEKLAGAVNRAVVNGDQLKIGERLVQDRPDRMRQVVPAVADGQDHADGGDIIEGIHRLDGHGCPKPRAPVRE